MTAFIGTELKESYFRSACNYLREAERVVQMPLFAGASR